MPKTLPREKHDHKPLHFPKGFLWGAATSALQVEGNLIHSEWWAWEQTSQPENFRSGKAADEYNLYEKDFELAQQLSHNAERLSIEWSRIEPKEGEFDEEEIEHYKKVLTSLRKKNMKVMLTLHHFSNPLWFSKKGGWTNLKSPNYFNRFVKKIVPELKDLVDFWITINEPGVYASSAYFLGDFPPQEKSKIKMALVIFNLSRAHKASYKTIHKLIPKAQVGIANQSVSFGIFHTHSFLESVTKWFMDTLTNHFFFMLTGKACHDFIGINYYRNLSISFNGQKRLPALKDLSDIPQDISDLGWEIYPEGIFDVIMDFSDYHKPIYITENGIASTNDDRRVRFLLSYLREIYHAIALGVDIRGYFHWSLIDNMELNKGFNPRFGLIAVDFKTQERTIRPSALVYKEIIEHNGIPHHLLKLLGHSTFVKRVLAEMKYYP